MQRWIVAVALVVGCSVGNSDTKPGPVTFSPTASDGDTSASTSGDSSGTDASEGTSTAATTTSAPTSMSTGMADGTTTGTDACEPDPSDDACFTCAKDHCCAAITDCEADLICSCALECIRQGNMADPCSEMCGGDSPATTALVGCAYIHCETECEGI